MTAGRSLREGSAQKRSAILAAARSLFLADGFDRTSMDAVAAQAAVSKRTVYDYYGDKRTLLSAVVEQAVEALSASVQQAIDENLVSVAGGADGLEDALVGFAESITASAIGSSDYSALRRLVSAEAAHLPELREKHWKVGEPEDAVAERFAAFDRDGLLAAPEPRLAADHFVALTLSPFTSGFGMPSPVIDTHRVIRDGVRAFLRAYRE
ncbi:TetR/AcrR family transcriptional regulator [Herbiconiux sp. P17]|uniref:TetR/AcrR family transcriptional regulator n=1 Tax=Herbiconiux wuyangfengii TaxID=3342794 RepID=UPI0035B81F5D